MTGAIRAQDVESAARLVALGMRPKLVPARDPGYAELVRRWLWAYGPGTEADLVWWLGSTKTSVRRGLADVDATPVRLHDGTPAWLHPHDVDVVGDPLRRVPHLLTCSVLYVDGETVTLELDRAGIAVSSGSACSASSETPSHVLSAMGALTHGNLRIGLTRTTTEAEVDTLLAALPPIVDRIRVSLGAP